jgi:hypothetical protein
VSCPAACDPLFKINLACVSRCAASMWALYLEEDNYFFFASPLHTLPTLVCMNKNPARRFPPPSTSTGPTFRCLPLHCVFTLSQQLHQRWDDSCSCNMFSFPASAVRSLMHAAAGAIPLLMKLLKEGARGAKVTGGQSVTGCSARQC